MASNQKPASEPSKPHDEGNKAASSVLLPPTVSTKSQHHPDAKPMKGIQHDAKPSGSPISSKQRKGSDGGMEIDKAEFNVQTAVQHDHKAEKGGKALDDSDNWHEDVPATPAMAQKELHIHPPADKGSRLLPEAGKEGRTTDAYIICCLSASLFGISAGMSSVFAGYWEISLLAPATNSAIDKDRHHLFSSLLFTTGGVMGAFLCGVVMTRWGRIIAFKVCALIHFIGALVPLLPSTNGEVLSGVVVAYTLVILPSYVIEISPASQRNFFGGLVAISLSFGILAATVANFVIEKSVVFTITAALISLIAFIMLKGIYESPRWLLTTKGVEEALKSFEALFQSGKRDDAEFQLFEQTGTAVDFKIVRFCVFCLCGLMTIKGGFDCALASITTGKNLPNTVETLVFPEIGAVGFSAFSALILGNIVNHGLLCSFSMMVEGITIVIGGCLAHFSNLMTYRVIRFFIRVVARSADGMGISFVILIKFGELIPTPAKQYLAPVVIAWYVIVIGCLSCLMVLVKLPQVSMSLFALILMFASQIVCRKDPIAKDTKDKTMENIHNTLKGTEGNANEPNLPSSSKPGGHDKKLTDYLLALIKQDKVPKRPSKVSVANNVHQELPKNQPAK